MMLPLPRVVDGTSVTPESKGKRNNKELTKCRVKETALNEHRNFGSPRGVAEGRRGGGQRALAVQLEVLLRAG